MSYPARAVGLGKYDILNSLEKNETILVTQIFCNITLDANLRLLYHITEADQVVEITCYGWQYRDRWSTDTLCIATHMTVQHSLNRELMLYDFEHDHKAAETTKNIPVLLLWLLDIGIMVRMFANGSEDLGSIPGRVIPKTQKMVLDASLLNTQHYQ